MKTLASKRKYEGMSGAWLIIMRGNNLLIGRRSEVCGEDVGKYNFIGGGVDDTDESPKHAAVREFKEECNVDLHDQWDAIKPLCSIFNPITGGTCHFFVLQVPTDKPFRVTPNEEHDRVGWLPLYGSSTSLMANLDMLNWPTMVSLAPLYSEISSS